ncbi:MAG TPA: pantoate--beta-alanine ligase [Iamia sp.]|nr:pantoate--beta-alanine ligase [Iamia sp.]HXH56151.1 pantoate--beta-alanine ligase [Iamia sp.]
MTTIAEVRAFAEEARAGGGAVGFVPTMGYLHEGHASLMAAARAECDRVVASVFVNPLQFGAGEDLGAYPRDIERDTALAAAAGVDLLFVPGAAEMYPGAVVTSVRVAEITDRFEGATRPGHFAGVATVVAKLFAIVGPCSAYFGEKDWQQVCVVRRMAADLSLPVRVVACPTSREPDGLARSSRNVYLTDDERSAAPVLRRALQAGADLVAAGVRDAARVEARVAEAVATEPLVVLDYVAAVSADTLAPLDPLVGEIRLLVAARVGRPRLLDNIGLTVPA